jgi:hydroxypyruvate isomerase
MPRFAANISFMYNEVEFLARFAAARRSGFDAVEFHYPYTFEKKLLREALDAARLKAVLINIPVGDKERGENGLACLPGREADFRAATALAIDYARALGVARLNCIAGLVPEGADQKEYRATFITNLRTAAIEFKKARLELMIEPLNTRDVPNFFLCHSRQAVEIIGDVGADNVRLQYDLYHMQIMEGDLAPTMERLLPHIGHIQFADTPGRHEPGTGELNFDFLFARIDRIGYRGWTSAEYRPSGLTADSLGWLPRYSAQ